MVPPTRACPLLTALLSDIHGNLEALNACLHHARSRGAERFAFLGDLVGYGADARAVVEVVCRYAAQGAVVLKGNHDQAIDRSSGYFNDASQASLRWARDTLTEEQKRFLAALPLFAREGTVCYVHASAAAPERWDYIDSPAAAKRCTEATDACYTFCGHVHDQVLYFESAQGRMSAFRPFPGTAIPARSHRRWVGSWAPWVSRATTIQPPPTRCLILTGRRLPFSASHTMRRPLRPRFAPVACLRRWPIAWSLASRFASLADNGRSRSPTMREPLHPGSVIDGYRLGECIHRGGTGAIYRATGPVDGELGFPLVFKVPYRGPGESAIGIISLEMEQTVLARLTQPHVPRFVAAGDIRAMPYVVMEWIEGSSVAESAARAPLAPEEVARIGAALADAVHSVHLQQVIHFDLKPENFMLRPHGEAVLRLRLRTPCALS